MGQVRLLARDCPEVWITKARGKWNPIKTFCLFSGGGDSSVVAHRCRAHYDELLFIDTGTSVPGVVDFVNEYAEWIGKPLRVESAGEAFERMVVGGINPQTGNHEDGHGFPGKAFHNKAYSRLKERQIETVLRDVKKGCSRTASVLFISGVRRDESRRRTNRMPLTEHGSARFVNPLIEWTNTEMEDYKVAHGIPRSDVSALLHRSGECNCGAFAKADEERAMMSGLWPEWFHGKIEVLEAEAERLGQRWCRWGGYDLEGRQAAGSSGAGPMCTDCVQQDELDLSLPLSRGGATDGC